jgi:hypothetical protein
MVNGHTTEAGGNILLSFAVFLACVAIVFGAAVVFDRVRRRKR